MVQEVTINWWSVLVGVPIVMAWGAIWYSPLVLAKPWMRRAGLTEESLATGAALGLTMAALGAFLVSWIFATVLAFAETANIVDGIAGGFFMGLFVAAAFMANDFMERRPATLWLINSGYWMVVLLSLGAMMGAWR